MAIDRQRFKKTYPSKRVRPRFESLDDGNGGGGEQIVYLETLVLTFTNSFVESIAASQEYSNPVILTSATENVNVYVSGVSVQNGVTVIEVSTSAAITGDVYIAIGEATNAPIQQVEVQP